MTSAIGKDDDFDNVKYRPEISFPQTNSQISPERMQNYMRDNVLSARAVPVSVMNYDQNQSVYVIDSCIRVKIPSETLRNEKAKQWEERHTRAKKWAFIEGGVGALLAGGTAASSIYNFPYLAMALGVASIANLILCAMNISNKTEASRQIEGWKANPLEKIASERAKAYQSGFPYVYDRNLKLQGSSHFQILLPQEVRFLFEKHFDSFYGNLLPKQPASEQGKKEWLDSFTSYNPVSNSLLRYAYDNNIPEKYTRVSYDYEVLSQQLKDIRKDFEKLRNKSEKETKEIIKGINQNRDLALAPFALTLAYWISEAKKIREEHLKYAVGDKEIEVIKDQYKASVRKYEMYHAAAIIPVNLIFDNQVSNAKDKLRDILKEIKKNEASSHAPYFNYAWGLLDFARQVKQQPTFVYQPQPFVPMQAFHIPQPSAPPVVNINFYQEAPKQRPKEIDDSNYADYLKFVSWEQKQEQGKNDPLYPNLTVTMDKPI